MSFFSLNQSHKFVLYHQETNIMAQRIYQLFFVSTLFLGLFACTNSTDTSPSDSNGNGGDSLNCHWTVDQVVFDSIDNCSMPDGRTRYFSHFYLHLDLAYSDILAGDTAELTFALSTRLPGQKCGNGTPKALRAVDNEGQELKAQALPCSSGATAEESVEECVEIQIDLPLKVNSNSSKGGLCLILETIDPLSEFFPEVLSLGAWEGKVGSETYTIVPSQVDQLNTELLVSPPDSPECTDCSFE